MIDGSNTENSIRVCILKQVARAMFVVRSGPCMPDKCRKRTSGSSSRGGESLTLGARCCFGEVKCSSAAKSRAYMNFCFSINNSLSGSDGRCIITVKNLGNVLSMSLTKGRLRLYINLLL